MNKEMHSELQGQGHLHRVGADIATTTDKTRATKFAFQIEVNSVDAKVVSFQVWLSAQATTSGVYTRLEPVGKNSLILLYALSESSAIEDILYELDRGLGDCTVNLDDFLREARRLANRQFLKKAHSTKIHAQVE